MEVITRHIHAVTQQASSVMGTIGDWLCGSVCYTSQVQCKNKVYMITFCTEFYELKGHLEPLAAAEIHNFEIHIIPARVLGFSVLNLERSYK